MRTQYEDEVRKYGEVEKKIIVDSRLLGDLLSPWGDREELVGYVCRTSKERRKIVKPIDENGISEEDWGSVVGVCGHKEEAEIREIPLDNGRLDCEDCGSREVYHDKRGEWFCPWCENG